VLLVVIYCGQCGPKNNETETKGGSVTGVSRMRIVSDDTLGLNIYYPDFDRIDVSIRQSAVVHILIAI